MNKNLRSILVSGFSLLLLLLLLIITTGLYYSSKNNSRMEEIVNIHNLRASQMSQLRNMSRELSVLYYKMVLSRDIFEIDELIQGTSEIAGDFLHIKELLKASSSRQIDLDRLDKMMALASHSYQLQNQVKELVINEQYAAASTLMVEKVQPSQNESVKFYDLMLQDQQKLVADAALAAHNAYWQSYFLMLAISGIAIVLGTIISIFTIKKISMAETILKRDNIELEKLVHERTLELHQLANMDALTGIFNRRRFNEALQMELARAKRYNKALALIIFDVDHFKKINDTFGHQSGDEVLKKLSSLITEALRDTDLFARWGGEEFIILTPDGDTTVPDILAERLRATIEAHDFGDIGHITCSFGVTKYQQGDDQKSIIKRADSNLYSAKHSGRNRVCYL